jgi:hypothetical protein
MPTKKSREDQAGGMKQGGLDREWDPAGIHELLAEKHIALTA